MKRIHIPSVSWNFEEGLIRLYYTAPCSSILSGQSVLPDVNLGLVCFFLFRKENCNNL